MVPEGLRLKLWDDRWRRRNITRRVHAPKNHGFRKTLGDVYLFAMVPYYDIGGGQRSAQLAKTLNKMGYSVHYVYAYESSDSGARDPYLPTVRHLPVRKLTPREVAASVRGTLAPTFIFEAPYAGYLPYLELARTTHARVIYEHIDNWETSLGSQFFDGAVFRRYLLEADVIAATTALLREHVVRFMAADPALAGRASRVAYVPNAVDTDLFDPSLPALSNAEPEDLVAGAPTLLYYGSLWGEWFDWELLRRVAEACPGSAINLIGDYTPVVDEDPRDAGQRALPRPQAAERAACLSVPVRPGAAAIQERRDREICLAAEGLRVPGDESARAGDGLARHCRLSEPVCIGLRRGLDRGRPGARRRPRAACRGARGGASVRGSKQLVRALQRAAGSRRG